MGGGSQKASMIARKPVAPPATAAKVKPIPKSSMFLLFLLCMKHVISCSLLE